MKLKKISLLFFMTLIVTMLFACGTKSTNNTKSEVNTRLPEGYIISFVSNGGNQVQPIEVQKGGKVSAPAEPTNTGYRFLGWYTDSSFNNEFDFTVVPSSDMTLYARWQIVNYTITYHLNGGTNAKNPTTYNIKSNDIALKDPTYTGMYFAGWYLDPEFTTKVTKIVTTEAKNLDLYAKWSDEEVFPEYSITYVLDGGENGDNPSSFDASMGMIQLENATKSGFTFDGWYLDPQFEILVTELDSTTDKNVTLYAKWIKGESVVKYQIYYHLSGGTNGKNISYYSSASEPFTLLKPTRKSCTFLGWYLDPTYETEIKVIEPTMTGDLDLYAKWVVGINEVQYSFDLGLGKEYVIYHVSDTHINAATNNEGVKNEQNWVGVDGKGGQRESFAKGFGEAYDLDVLSKSSTENFTKIISYINSNNPTAACFTGDLMDYYCGENFTFINRELKKLTVPFAYALGNHEDPPTSFYGMAGMTTSDFTVIEFDDFEIICLDNSNKDIQGRYCYNENQLNLLTEEVNKGKTIIIMEHIPLLNEYNNTSRIKQCGDYYYIDRNNCNATTASVFDLIANSSNVKLVLCGHIHGGTLTEINDGKYQVTCSSGLIGIINRITIY